MSGRVERVCQVTACGAPGQGCAHVPRVRLFGKRRLEEYVAPPRPNSIAMPALDRSDLGPTLRHLPTYQVEHLYARLPRAHGASAHPPTDAMREAIAQARERGELIGRLNAFDRALLGLEAPAVAAGGLAAPVPVRQAPEPPPAPRPPERPLPCVAIGTPAWHVTGQTPEHVWAESRVTFEVRVEGPARSARVFFDVCRGGRLLGEGFVASARVADGAARAEWTARVPPPTDDDGAITVRASLGGPDGTQQAGTLVESGHVALPLAVQAGRLVMTCDAPRGAGLRDPYRETACPAHADGDALAAAFAFTPAGHHPVALESAEPSL